MKQKTRFENFGNIGYRYRPMNGRYIGIGHKKDHIGRSLVMNTFLCQEPLFDRAELP